MCYIRDLSQHECEHIEDQELADQVRPDFLEFDGGQDDEYAGGFADAAALLNNVPHIVVTPPTIETDFDSDTTTSQEEYIDHLETPPPMVPLTASTNPLVVLQRIRDYLADAQVRLGPNESVTGDASIAERIRLVMEHTQHTFDVLMPLNQPVTMQSPFGGTMTLTLTLCPENPQPEDVAMYDSDTAPPAPPAPPTPPTTKDDMDMVD